MQLCDTASLVTMLMTAKNNNKRCPFLITALITVLTLGGGSRRVWRMCEAEKASFFPTGQDLWIYLHLRSDSFTSHEWDVLCSAGYYKNTAIVLNILHFACHFLERDSAALDSSLFFPFPPFFILSGWLVGWRLGLPPLHLAGIIHHF